MDWVQTFAEQRGDVLKSLHNCPRIKSWVKINFRSEYNELFPHKELTKNLFPLIYILKIHTALLHRGVYTTVWLNTRTGVLLSSGGRTGQERWDLVDWRPPPPHCHLLICRFRWTARPSSGKVERRRRTDFVCNCELDFRDFYFIYFIYQWSSFMKDGVVMSLPGEREFWEQQSDNKDKQRNNEDWRLKTLL